VLNEPLPALDDGYAIIFFNRSERFRYERPDSPVDYASGVVCSPRAFRFEDGDEPPHPSLRATLLANHDRWAAMSEEEYRRAKREVSEKALAMAAETAGVGGLEGRTLLTDCFTPLTIKRYTGKLNGAIYGAPRKRKDGTTPLEGLFVCGTDQGFLGITGSMLSGISMANAHALR
jgi:phytoene dehydrogenase-like protein